jgi:hypothetical protein
MRTNCLYLVPQWQCSRSSAQKKRTFLADCSNESSTIHKMK